MPPSHARRGHWPRAFTGAQLRDVFACHRCGRIECVGAIGLEMPYGLSVGSAFVDGLVLMGNGVFAGDLPVFLQQRRKETAGREGITGGVLGFRGENRHHRQLRREVSAARGRHIAEWHNNEASKAGLMSTTRLPKPRWCSAVRSGRWCARNDYAISAERG